MFTGHFAVALAVAGRARRVPMGILVLAVFAGDIVEALPALAGVRDTFRVWSHSLPATLAAGLLIAAGWKAAGGSWTDVSAIVVAAVSHTALDLITGFKTLVPGVAPMGLSLYSYPVVEYMLEIGAVLTGWVIWRQALPAHTRRRAPDWAMLALLVGAQTMLLVYVLAFGPPADTGALSKFVR